MKLYKEASLMMLPTSVKDGKLYSIFPQPKPLSGELVTNGTFDTDSDWTKQTGWSISGGSANYDFTTNSTYLRQTLLSSGFVSGKSYRINFEITDGTAYMNIKSNAETLESTNLYSIGSYSIYVTASANGSDLLIYGLNTQGTAFSIDNISVVEVDQLPADFDFSRGSNLAATRINEQGLIEKGRENLLLQSNQFDTTWTTSNATPTGGQSGYDGSSDAWLLTKSAASGLIKQNYNTSGVYTYSVYAKAGSSNWVQLHSNGRFAQYFDLQNGVVGTFFGTIITAEIEDVGNGWYRCSVTDNGSNGGELRIYPAEGQDDVSGTSGSIYIQDAQLEVGLVATDYIESGATTGKAGVLEDLPRLNWGGNCPSLLLEPQRQNLFTYSEYFGGWDLVNSGAGSLPIITENYIQSPSGEINAYRLQMETNGSSSSDQSYIKDGLTLDGSSDYVFSFYIKSNTGVNQQLISFINNSFGDQFTATNEWTRIEIPFTSNSTNVRNFGLMARGHIQQSVDVSIYGAQLEQGSYPTSYIPTHGTSVTRSYDSFENTNLGDYIGTGDATFFFDFDFDVVRESGGYLYRIYSGTDSFGLKVSSTTNRTLQLRAIAGFTTHITINEAASETSHKVLVRVTGDVVEVFYNGTKITGTMTGLSTYAWSEYEVTGNNSFVGKTKELTIFNTALSDNECINLTSI